MESKDILYSRVLENVAKIQEASLLMLGGGAVATETCKNLLLHGIKQVILVDNCLTSHNDVSANVACNDVNEVGKVQRGHLVLQFLRSRAQRWQNVLWLKEVPTITDDYISQFSAVVCCSPFSPFSDQAKLINQICRRNQVGFFSSLIYGFCGGIISDMGPIHTFTKEDKLSSSSVIQQIDAINVTTTTVSFNIRMMEFYFVQPGSKVSIIKHGNEKLFIGEVVDINRKCLNVDYCSNNEQELQLLINSITELQNKKKTLSITPLPTICKSTNVSVDTFFEKQQDPVMYPHFSSNSATIKAVLLALSKYELESVQCSKRKPLAIAPNEFGYIVQLAKQFLPTNVTFNNEIAHNVIAQANGSIAPMASIFGGFLSKEVIKFSTKQSEPIDQWFQFEGLCFANPQSNDVINNGLQKDRYYAQEIIIGKDVQQRLLKLRPFIVGAGALGCETLKLFAKMGVSCTTGGSISLADSDSVSLSNLSRQLLFTSKDIDCNKATCSAIATKLINNNINIEPYNKLVDEKSEKVFNEKFYELLDCIIACVDSSLARQYLNMQSHFYKKTLLEAGTSYNAFSTQVVVPFTTEPLILPVSGGTHVVGCSAKHFPVSVAHCVHNAVIHFNQFFSSALQNLCCSLKNGTTFEELIASKEVSTVKILAILSKGSTNEVNEVIGMLFQTWFNLGYQQDIAQHPLNEVENGVAYWGTKRLYPNPITKATHNTLFTGFQNACMQIITNVVLPLNPGEFDKDNMYHVNFVHAYTRCLATVFSLPNPTAQETQHIAGSIYPSSIFTTCIAAGLSALQLYKLPERKCLRKYNGDVSGTVMHSELELLEGDCNNPLTYPVFSRILEITCNVPQITVQQVITKINNKYNMEVRRLFDCTRTIFLGSLSKNADHIYHFEQGNKYLKLQAEVKVGAGKQLHYYFYVLKITLN